MVMRYGFLVLVFLVSLQAAGQDTVFVQQVNSPLLLDRSDNVLVRLRVKVDEPSVFRGVRLALSLEGVGDVRGSTTDVVKAVRLFYAGTEAPQRASGFFMAPVGYLSSGTPGRTLAANPSYSLVQSEVKGPKGEVMLASGQPLFAGIHYFWVSVQLQAKAPLTAKLSASVVSVSLEKRVSLNGADALEVAEAVLQQVGQKPPFYRLGVGVRHAGNDGSAAFRIPGLVTSNKGTLLGVYDVRYNNSADLQEHVDIGLSRSTNGGQSWEKMRIIMDMGTFGGLPEGQNGVGDPSILVDTQTGYIWVVAAWTHAMGNGRAWVNSRSGMSVHETAQLLMVYSKDDGKTWSKPINVTPQVKDPSWRFLLQGPGRGITMDNGTLVFPAQFINDKGVPSSCVMYSSDRGKTWQLHSPARPNTTESAVVETEPGVLMLNMRDDRGGSRAVMVSNDMGKTWADHPSTRLVLQEPVCMASLIRAKGSENSTGRDILFFSNPNSTQARRDITIKASLDSGLSFPAQHQVLLDEESGWGYSCLTLIDKETIGILYESSAAHMVFQAIPVADFFR